MKKRLLTGVRCTSKLHIGNYFGIIPSIQANINEELFLFAADLHSLTNKDFNSYYEIIKLFMATINGNNIHYYVQSRFCEFSYLAWILTCNTSFGELKRMTQFKSKENETISSGYLFYPMLMCADILLPGATHVPVGIDQMQHMELVRDVAKLMNNRFNCNFTVPEYILNKSYKVMDLQDGLKKMSKSNYSNISTIYIDDSNDEMFNKIFKAKTDAFLMPDNIQSIKNSRIEVYNLCCLFTYCTGKDFVYIEKEFGGHYMSKFKTSLANVIIDLFSNIRDNMKSITNQEVDDLLNKSYSHVSSLLSENLRQIKSCVFQYK